MNINQLKQLRNLNIELLETLLQTLSSIDDYCKEHSIPLLTDSKIENLVRHTLKLIHEINAEVSIPTNLVRRIFTTKKNRRGLYRACFHVEQFSLLSP